MAETATRQRAAADFGCSPADITVALFDEKAPVTPQRQRLAFTATGCGKTGTFVVSCRFDDWSTDACRAVPTENPDAPAPYTQPILHD